MSTTNKAISDKILNQIKAVYNIKTDVAFAEFLGIRQSTLASWRGRGRANFNFIMEKCPDLDFGIINRALEINLSPEKELILTQRQALDLAQDKINRQERELENLRRKMGMPHIGLRKMEKAQ